MNKIISLTFTAALVSIAACKGGAAAEADSAAAETTTVGIENIAVVTNGVLQAGPTVSGALMPEREAVVRAQVGGSVLQTYVDQGQSVRAGQTLARIEAGGFELFPSGGYTPFGRLATTDDAGLPVKSSLTGFQFGLVMRASR